MLRDTQNTAPNVTTEILVRIILLLIVIIMQANIQPHIQYITKTELLRLYKRPRKETLTPTWIAVFLIIFVPLVIITIPYMQARNYAETIQALLAWSLACALNAFITETVKLTIGRPRPDFFYRCFPDGKVTGDLRCTGDLKDVIDGRKSFPSGHSSFSFCSLGFVSVWICGKLGVLSRSRGHGIRVIACLLPLLAASAVAMSRHCDNLHHWEDVVTGSILGFTLSYFCYRQYYHPLDSEQSGMPNVIVIESSLLDTKSEYECCTKDLEAIMSIHDKEK